MKNNFSQKISTQKVLFVLGKGGVGKTILSASLAQYFSSKNEKVLIVQWALKDSISPIYDLAPCGHQTVTLPCGFSVMNYNSSETIREYFLQHLKMKLIYNLVIENKHVQKFIKAAPGIAELFFLGRLFWLSELSKSNESNKFDRIIVDAPATGHGVSLFKIAKTISNLGITGPLAKECERVQNLLNDSSKTGYFITSIPEELPYEEMKKLTQEMQKNLNYSPLGIFLNLSIHKYVSKEKTKDITIYFEGLSSDFKSKDSVSDLYHLKNILMDRNKIEALSQTWCQENNFPCFLIPDQSLIQKNISDREIVDLVTKEMNL